MGLFYSRSAGAVDGEVVFSRRVLFRGFPSTVTIYSTVWGTGCFVDVGDSTLPGIDSFSLEDFTVKHMPRVRDAVIRGISRGLDFEDSVINALRVEAVNYLRGVGVNVSSDDANKWASLLFRGLYNYGVLEPVMVVSDEVGLTDIYVAPGARVHFKLSSLGDCQSNVVPSTREVELLVSVIGDRVGVYPTYYNPSVEAYDRGHRPMLRVSVDSFDVTDRTRVSIRVFPTRAWKLIDMVRLGSIDARLAAYLWLALEVGVPILVIGPAGSGKTSMSAALMSALPPSTVIAKSRTSTRSYSPRNWLVIMRAASFRCLVVRVMEPASSPYRFFRGLSMHLGLAPITYLLMRLGARGYQGLVACNYERAGWWGHHDARWWR